MKDFDDRTHLWNYRDNSVPNRPSANSSSSSRRGQDSARAYAALDEEERARRDPQHHHQSQNYQSPDWQPQDRHPQDWRDDGYGNRSSRQGRYGPSHRNPSDESRERDYRRTEDYYRTINAARGAPQDQSPARWPSELGYPPARQYSAYDGSQGARSDYDREHRGFFDRAGDEFLSWFGDRDATRRRDLDHRGRGPKTYVRSDERIREDVNDRLTEDVWVDASEIEVAVAEGEVTLSGTVHDRSTKRRAEDCADAVTGVKHVQNNLRYTSTIISPTLD